MKAALDFLHLTAGTGLACAGIQVRVGVGKAPSCPDPLHLFFRFHPRTLHSLSTCSASDPALAAGNRVSQGTCAAEEQTGPHLDGRTPRAPRARWSTCPRPHVRTRGPRSSPVPLPGTDTRAPGSMSAPVLTTPQATAAPARPSLSPWEPLASCHHITPPDLALAPQIKHTLITHKRTVNVIY